jgi:hypothetical protein
MTSLLVLGLAFVFASLFNYILLFSDAFPLFPFFPPLILIIKISIFNHIRVSTIFPLWHGQSRKAGIEIMKLPEYFLLDEA